LSENYKDLDMSYTIVRILQKCTHYLYQACRSSPPFHTPPLHRPRRIWWRVQVFKRVSTVAESVCPLGRVRP